MGEPCRFGDRLDVEGRLRSDHRRTRTTFAVQSQREKGGLCRRTSVRCSTQKRSEEHPRQSPVERGETGKCHCDRPSSTQKEEDCRSFVFLIRCYADWGIGI